MSRCVTCVWHKPSETRWGFAWERREEVDPVLSGNVLPFTTLLLIARHVHHSAFSLPYSRLTLLSCARRCFLNHPSACQRGLLLCGCRTSLGAISRAELTPPQSVFHSCLLASPPGNVSLKLTPCLHLFMSTPVRPLENPTFFLYILKCPGFFPMLYFNLFVSAQLIN